MTASNTVILIGRVGGDPEVKTFSEKTVAKFTLAVDRGYKSADGNKITDWFNCEIWGKQAQTFSQYARKGTQVAVVGSINLYVKEMPDSKSTYVTINVGSFQLLSSKDRDSSNKESKVSSSNQRDQISLLDDDLPPF
jgi:single-strand DNA-binding protein